MNTKSKQASRQRAVIQISTAMAAIVPMVALTVWMYLTRNSVPGLSEFFLGLLLFGGSMIFWLLFLHIVVCRDSLQSIGFKSVLMGWFFMATGRTRALITSHAIYDSVQIIMAVVAIRAVFAS